MLLICLVLIILISDIELTLVQVYLFVMVSVRCMGFVCVCGRGGDPGIEVTSSGNP